MTWIRRAGGLALLLSLIACTITKLDLTEISRPTATSFPLGWSRLTLGGGGGQTGIAIDPNNSEVVYVTTDNGGIVKTTDGGETWFSINNNLGNRKLGTIVMDPLNPQVLYVTAEVKTERRDESDDPVNGELYRTREGGQHWEIVYAEGMGGEGRSFGIAQWPSTRNLVIPFNPAEPRRYDADGDQLSDVIYVGGWDETPSGTDKRAGLWKSVDEGQTFQQLALHDRNIWVLRQDPDEPETLYAGTYGAGLFVSRDGGVTWEDWSRRIPLPMISDLAVVPNSHTLYVATNTFYSEYQEESYRPWRGVYKSTDAGLSFAQVNTGLENTSLNFQVLMLDARDPSGQTLYTGPWSGSQQGIYHTTDGGGHWTLMPYQKLNNPPWFDDFDNLWAIAQSPDGALFAATWRGVYRYTPDRRQWDLKINGLGNISVQRLAFEPGNSDTIYLGILDSTPWKSVDGGATWMNIGNGFVTSDGVKRANAADFAVSPMTVQTIYAAGIGPSGSYLSAINRSVDGGLHWEPIVNGLPPSSSQDPQWQATGIMASALDPMTAYVALELRSGGGRIYKTTSGGRVWEEAFSFPEKPTDLAISATVPETVVCATRNGLLYVGAEGGREWRVTRVGNTLLYAVDVFPDDPDRILVGANIAGAFLTTDGGQSWQHIFDDDQLKPLMEGLALSPYARERYWPTIRAVKFDSTDPETLYLGHNPNPWIGVGVLKSTDGGQHWSMMADLNFQMRSVTTLDVDGASGNLVAGAWEVYYYRPGSQ